VPYARMTPEGIADRLEISDLLTRYTVAIDRQDWSLLDQCFTSDAFVDYVSSGGVKGRYPEVRAWLEKAIALFDVTMHFISNSVVELGGDAATARTYVINPMGRKQEDGSMHIFTVGAYYNDELVRTDEGWRISQRIEEQAYMEGTFPTNLVAPG